MKSLRSTVGILLALLMLFSCMPLALAGGAIKENEEKSPGLETRTPVEMSLGEAAAFPDEDRPLPLTCDTARVYDWRVMHGTGFGKFVRGGGADFGNVSFRIIEMYADVEMDPSAYPYVSFMMRQYKKCTLTLTCHNYETDSDYTLLTSEHTNAMSNDWQGCYAELNDPYQGTARLRFTFELTLYEAGSGCYCDIANLRYGLANDINDVLRGPGSDITFGVSGNCGGCSYIYKSTDPLCNYLVLECGEDAASDPEQTVSTQVFAAQGDVLSFNYACSLDYMDGANFYFGTYDDTTGFTRITENEDEGGDGYIEDGYVEEWAEYSYTIPATGWYTFVWKLCAYSSASCLALDDISITPKMSMYRALLSPGCSVDEIVFTGYGVWAPAELDGQLCAKSGPISHSEYTNFSADLHIMDEGAQITFDYRTSSEANFDKLIVYITNMITGDEITILTASGLDTDWHSFSYSVPERGWYHLFMEYRKDSSLSRGDDCAYVKNLMIEDMTIADYIPQEYRDRISLQPVYSNGALCYGFSPTVYNFEDIVLCPDNQGLHSTSAEIELTAFLRKGEKIAFDYMLDAEEGVDGFSAVETNGITDASLEDYELTNGWTTAEFTALTTGYSGITLKYTKDYSVNDNGDYVLLKNFRIIPRPDLNEALNPDDGSYYDEYEHADFTPDYFDAAELDGRLAAFVSGNDIGTFGTKNARTMVYGEYVFFDYKIVGGGEIRVSVDNTGTGWVAGDTGGEWIPAKLRIDYTGEHLYFTGDPQGGTVYIDNVRVGHDEIPLDEAVNKPDTRIWFEPDSDDFIGVNDPDNPTVNAYALAHGVTHAEMSWTFDAIPGDRFEAVMMFVNPEDDPCGASVTFSINGEDDSTFEDNDIYSMTGMVQKWMKISGFGVLHAGQVTITVEYDMPYAQPGYGFCFGMVYATTPGATLDQALNVPGGDLHFAVPQDNDAVFYPVNDGERIYAYPNLDHLEGTGFEYDYSFEAGEDLSGFITGDQDGDNSSFVFTSYSSVGLPLSGGLGTELAYSASNTNPNSPLTDDWLLLPRVTIPTGSAQASVSLLYTSLSPGPETIEVWVVYADHDFEQFGEMIYTETLTDNERHNIGIAISQYCWMPIRIAIRHRAQQHSAGGIVIDGMRISAADAYYSMFTFGADVNQYDRISFDLKTQLFVDGAPTNNSYLVVYEDGRQVFFANLTNIYNLYGDDWGGFNIYAGSTGNHIYRFMMCAAPDSDYDGVISVDNVEVHSTYVPPITINSIELLGYTLPDPTTALPYDGGLYTLQEGYHIASVTWYPDNAVEPVPATEFIAGESYYAEILLEADAGYEFGGRITVSVENDPDAWASYYTGSEAVICTSSFICPEGQAGMPGDIDGNGVVDMSDVSMLFSYLNGSAQLTPGGYANADVNGDGLISVMDISAIYGIIANS